MNRKQSKKLKKLAYTLTKHACLDKKVEYKDVSHTEMTSKRKKAKRIKSTVDKSAVREYEHNLMLGHKVDEAKEKEFYEDYDISLGTIKLSQICGRKVYQDMKKSFKKSIAHKKQILQLS